MRLDSIIRVEKFIVDALIGSPEIPLSVQVLRLADAIENEGTVNQTNTIIVRYTNSYSIDKLRTPLVTERVANFTIEFVCQNYLSSSGHDFALTLMSAVFNTLAGKVPPNSGLQTVEGFKLETESYDGLTDNSQYTYSQNWEIVVEQTSAQLPLDPCVARGDCSQAWPPPNVLGEDETPEPWEVIFDNSIYTPCCTTDENGEPGITVQEESSDWVYLCDGNIFFSLEDQEDLILLPNGVVDDNTIIVRAFRISDNQLLGEFKYQATGRKVARVSAGLWRSPSGLVGQEDVSGVEEFSVNNLSGRGTQYSIIIRPTIAVSDPLNPNRLTRSIPVGSTISVTETTLTTDGRIWVLTELNGTPWVPLNSVEPLIEEENGCEIANEEPEKIC